MSVDDDSQSRRRDDAAVGGAAEGLRILAVDDDRSYLAYISLVLRRAGFSVEGAAHGSEAIQRIAQPPPIDLLLVDLTMPDLDGIETVRRIHETTPAYGLYTILLTASTGTEVKLRALESGFDDFLTKNSSETEIVAKIRSAARRLRMERRLALQNEELQTLALTDELTGVANRRALMRGGEQILKEGRALSVILIDLDRFKEINDTLGHLAGDRVLREVAASLTANTRYGDIIGRYGGDEFVLLLPDTAATEARQISRRIIARIRQPIWTVTPDPLRVSARVGVATSPSGGKTLEELLFTCDQALYRAKRRVRTNPGATDRPSIR